MRCTGLFPSAVHVVPFHLEMAVFMPGKAEHYSCIASQDARVGNGAHAFCCRTEDDRTGTHTSVRSDPVLRHFHPRLRFRSQKSHDAKQQNYYVPITFHSFIRSFVHSFISLLLSRRHSGILRSGSWPIGLRIADPHARSLPRVTGSKLRTSDHIPISHTAALRLCGC